MGDVPGTTLNSVPFWNAWLQQLHENAATRALPMFTYNSNSRPMMTPQGIPGPDMPVRANANTLPGMPPVGSYPRTPPPLPAAGNSNNYLTPVGGGLPLMAPPMLGHPVGLREREKAILDKFLKDD